MPAPLTCEELERCSASQSFAADAAALAAAVAGAPGVPAGRPLETAAATAGDGWELAGTEVMVTPVRWMGLLGLGVQGCYEAVMNDPSCGKDYFNYVPRGDENCGCREVTTRDNGVVDYYKIVAPPPSPPPAAPDSPTASEIAQAVVAAMPAPFTCEELERCAAPSPTPPSFPGCDSAAPRAVITGERHLSSGRIDFEIDGHEFRNAFDPNGGATGAFEACQWRNGEVIWAGTIRFYFLGGAGRVDPGDPSSAEFDWTVGDELSPRVI
jgi:hypothetical protein